MTLSLPTDRYQPAGDGSMTDLVLANARLVLADRVLEGSIVVADGQIVEVSEGTDVPPGAVDCNGDHILPGLIELHTDNLERHIEPRPAVDWPHAAAILAHDAELAGAGITTVFDALRVGSVVENDRTRYLPYARGLATEILGVRATGALRIDHRIHLRAEVCSETLIEELAQFGPEDRVGLLSLMDHTPGQRQFRDITKLKAYVCGKRGLSESEFEAHIAAQLALRERFGAAHEAAAVAFARSNGAVLASHDDTDAEQVATSATHGARIAEFPTTVEAAQACRDAGIAVMMGAPNLIRGGSHSGNVAAQALAEAGLLDVVSSDYVPSALLSSVFVLERLWTDLPRAVSTVTSAPARATGLTDRGRIAPGLRADLLRVASIGPHRVLRGVWSAGRRAA